MKLLISQQLLEIFPPLLFLVDSSEDDIPLTPSFAFILLLGTIHTAAKEPALLSSLPGKRSLVIANSFYQSGVSWRRDEVRQLFGDGSKDTRS